MRQATNVTLTSKELKWCYRHATNIVDHFGGENSRGSGTYNHNRVDGNLVGVKGELGLTRWLQDYFEPQDIQSNFKSFTDSGKRGDIQCNGKVIEVKGLRPHQWEVSPHREWKTYRRMVPPHQLQKYVKNDAIVVWITSTGNIINSTVQIKGWNYAHDVLNRGRNVKTICDNVWLEHDGDMRDMASLIPVLRGEDGHGLQP